jgi:hypothetical protein
MNKLDKDLKSVKINNMEQKIINTGDYLLIVDDSEKKIGDFCYNSIKNTWSEDIILYQDTMPKYHYVGFKKIISHLPLNNSPILEGVDLLPPLEKYKYTKEDLKKAFFSGGNFKNIEEFDYFIQSLQQPKMPVGFKCVCICSQCEARKQGFTLNTNCKKEYITTNSQGLTQLAGEYIY